jgi:hypothetical protein
LGLFGVHRGGLVFLVWLVGVGSVCDLELEPLLCLRSAIELLVDRHVGPVKDDEGRGRVRVSLEDAIDGGVHLEKSSQLVLEGTGSQIPQGELEAAHTSIVINLQRHQRLRADRRSRHDVMNVMAMR